MMGHLAQASACPNVVRKTGARVSGLAMLRHGVLKDKLAVGRRPAQQVLGMLLKHLIKICSEGKAWILKTLHGY